MPAVFSVLPGLLVMFTTEISYTSDSQRVAYATAPNLPVDYYGFMVIEGTNDSQNDEAEERRPQTHEVVPLMPVTHQQQDRSRSRLEGSMEALGGLNPRLHQALLANEVLLTLPTEATVPGDELAQERQRKADLPELPPEGEYPGA